MKLSIDNTKKRYEGNLLISNTWRFRGFPPQKSFRTMSAEVCYLSETEQIMRFCLSFLFCPAGFSLRILRLMRSR